MQDGFCKFLQISSKFPNSPSEQADVGTSQVCAGRWESFNWLRGDAQLSNALTLGLQQFHKWYIITCKPEENDEKTASYEIR